jgi:uncharacterized protein
MAPFHFITRRMALCGGLASLACLAVGNAAEPAAAAKPKPREPRMVDWEELLPEKERGRAEDPAASLHDYLSEDGPSMKQTGSSATVTRFNGSRVKVPGFVVPITLSKQGVVGEFLLVPYYGACIHIPPPPPNQIIYVKLLTPMSITTIWEPYWVTGVLSTTRKDTRMASAAYSIAGEKLEAYEY